MMSFLIGLVIVIGYVFPTVLTGYLKYRSEDKLVFVDYFIILFPVLNWLVIVQGLLLSVAEDRLKKMFEASLHTGALIAVNDRLRGIGKTKLLSEKALELNIPIIVKNYHSHRENSDVKFIVYNGNRSNLEGMRTDVLIEEGFTASEIKEIRSIHGINIVGGFINIDRTE